MSTPDDFKFSTRLIPHEGPQSIHSLTVANASGFSLTCLSYGATITSVKAPDMYGNVEEITLCYRGDEEMRNELIGKTGPYYGCIVGRVANRIKEGKFTLDGKTYELAVNNGKNALHGGVAGFDKQIWSWQIVCPDINTAGFKLSYTSMDNEEGYPGTVDVDVFYLITTGSELVMRYVASTDKATPINITNHTYWNLSGDCRRSILSHRLFSPSSAYIPVDANQIPTGEQKSVKESPFDLTSSRGTLLGECVPQVDGGGQRGLDHTWVVDGPAETRTMNFDQCGGRPRLYTLKHAATLIDEASGRQMSLSTTQPGVQLYRFTTRCAIYTLIDPWLTKYRTQCQLAS